MTDKPYNIDPHEDLNKDNVPEEAWDTSERTDMETGTNRYMQMRMSDTLKTIDNEMEKARENDHPFNTFVVLLARNGEARIKGKLENTDSDYDEGIERYFTQVGNRDYAIDLAVQFAIESSKELLSDILDNNPKMTNEEYRQLEKGLGYNMIKRIIDEFNLTDPDINLNNLKGNLSDVVEIRNQEGEELDL